MSPATPIGLRFLPLALGLQVERGLLGPYLRAALRMNPIADLPTENRPRTPRESP